MSVLFLKYFVLNPTKQDAYGAASKHAIRAYAAQIRSEDRELSKNLVAWLKEIADAKVDPKVDSS